MGNFCGHPGFSFYFIPPFLLAVLPSYLFNIPLTITLKMAIMSGIFLLPVTTYAGLRKMDYPFPTPIMGAGASLLFLFNESYTMFGGNTLSTLAGEFCYMFAFSLFAYFIGSLYEGAKHHRRAVPNGILLGLIGLCHLFVFIPALVLLIYWSFQKNTVRYLLRVSLVAFGMMAFWLLPLLAYRHPYTTPVYMIWNDFLSWRYTWAGIGIILLFVGPRMALCALGQKGSFPPLWRKWDLPMLIFTGLGAFCFFYLLAQLFILGSDLWATGLKAPGFLYSPLGTKAARFLSPFPAPVSLALSLAILGIGLWSHSTGYRFDRFCWAAGAASLLIGLALSSAGLYNLISRSMAGPRLGAPFLPMPLMAVTGAVMLFAGGVLFFSRRFRAFVLRRIDGDSERFVMLICLGFGCVTAYFSAHFLKIPDIRFLPPLLYALLLIFFADTLAPFVPASGLTRKTAAAMALSYLCMAAVAFGTTKSHVWFRYNNTGYAYKPGYPEFTAANDYLKSAYKGTYPDPLNAPRVGYEKSDLYAPYGGDRVFESLPLFSGRQTMEGIHYTSSLASRCITFLQTEYSRDIKTPRPYILSRMNPEGLPAHFALYNISQLILMSDEAKRAVASSPFFEKEAVFGRISIYRYKGCDGRYVDVPRIRPVIYTGKNWVEAFYRWYKDPAGVDVLLVPKAFVKDKADQSVFTSETGSVAPLAAFREDRLDRTGLTIRTHLEPMGIRFTTTKVGLPHLVKVSYFPNWRVKGAHALYPVSPHLMLVIPRQREVVITYGATCWGLIGKGLTAGTLLTLLLVWGRRILIRRFPAQGPVRRVPRRPDKEAAPRPDRGRNALENLGRGPAEGTLKAIRPLLLVGVIVTALALIAGGALLRNRPVRAFVEGYRAFQRGHELSQAGKRAKGKASFEKALRKMAPIISRRAAYDHRDVINCMLFSALSYERLGKRKEAEGFYRALLAEYPYSRYAGEAYVKLGRIQRHGRDRGLEAGIDQLRKGNTAAGLASLREALRRTREGLNFLHSAIREDPYSVWAQYARHEIEHELNYIGQKKHSILALSPAGDVRRSLLSLMRNGQ
jgi:hypothetical protein